MNYYEEFPETEPKTLAETTTPQRKALYANMGVDLSKYTSWEDLETDLWATERESVFPEERYQARVTHADSKPLALRAFLYNLFEHFTL